MNYYFATITHDGLVIERGWMLAGTDTELVDYAHRMQCGIDVVYLGVADMTAALPLLVPGTESAIGRRLLAGDGMPT